MEDPLRPKAVPLAAETVLWFEFLLDPQLVTKHLKKANPEPSALELITQFIAMAPDVPPRVGEVITPGVELQTIPGTVVTTTATSTPALTTSQTGQVVTENGLHMTRKQLALKVLALKVATWLKWDLDLLESKLYVHMLLQLLRDLCTLSFGRHVSVPLPVDFQPIITPEGNERAARFALTIYHRLLLRLQPMKEAVLKAPRPIMNNIYPAIDQLQQFFDTPTQPSVDFLVELGQNSDPFYVFNYDTFVTLHPGLETRCQNYDIMHMIPLNELRAQIHYDLANFYLFTRQYLLARESAHICTLNLQEARREYQLRNKREQEFKFCHLSTTMLEGLLLACGISNQPITLLERFNESLLTSYADIVEILKVDNRLREIPLVNRRNVELDIEGSISQGLLKVETRQLELQVAALNVVRNIFESGNIFGTVEYFEKYREFNCFPPIIEAVHDVLPHCNRNELNALKHFLIDCILHHNDGKQLLKQTQDISIFTPAELTELEEQLSEAQFPVATLARLNDWKSNSSLPRIEIGSLERQLIACTNAAAVRVLLVKLASTIPTKPLWAINPSWEIPTPLKSLLTAMQRGFMQDFAYVLLGKARELSAKGDYIGAVSMLSVLKSETQRQELSNTQMVGKLGKLVNWEILHIQITQCLEEWHQKPLDMQSLAARCKQCLSSVQNGDNIIPRIEIIENCAMMLLNLTDFQALMLRLPQLELPLAFAGTFLEMEKMKGPKKVYRDAWELVLSMFLNNANKRGTGGTGGSSRNSPCLAVSTSLQPFLKRLRHQSLFSLAISILGKIHNILKDDPNHDLNCEYMQLWPTSISNPISYSLRSVCETLQWLLTEALRFYPQTVSWLKMKGDLELAIGNNESAMRCYVNALVTGTDYCTIPLQRNFADDFIIRKMIRCAANLGCHMQATVLCQFLDEIDYAIVFKNLSEKASNFTDCMDAYYSCIWDTTLMEFIINMHAKRGEHSRKLEAISVMGTLELNANNNEEIRREAAAIRKGRFLRALAKQYLL